MFQTFNLHHVGFLLQCGTWTVALSGIALAGGAIGGSIIALMRLSRFAWLRWIAQAYIYVIQGTPLLVILFIAYFGVANLGYDLPAIYAAGLGFTLYSSAFLGEIWRGSIQSINKGQWEASFVLALGWRHTMTDVIIPQALRVAIPPTVGFSVQVVKNTALASVVGFIELTRAGQIVSSATFQPLPVYLTVAAIYFGICSILSHASRRLECRLHQAAN
ncbi:MULTISPECIES: amino acid ABC transporter permease [unclassified Mesorhizobium]|uniref:amino acid ABC transporter permease n=1 Tax=unclassified Mesorhizobium TaxID=325217 RepID=UPI00112CD356|nr:MULTISPECIES: amino acid ABC transporter permease [unclassified Mesorhizobium]MBZ9704296.1 amino acid ABC transporter permease [Mesorhizobium sp. CO1-1-3]MBZ9950873.1 amino acid ABC transporter permease [Mesorhizobium sp. BR1-1-11]TPI95061.1 amino acid ABC transporter permease [Mesorhizobium sp. B2-8-1]